MDILISKWVTGWIYVYNWIIAMIKIDHEKHKKLAPGSSAWRDWTQHLGSNPSSNPDWSVTLSHSFNASHPFPLTRKRGCLLVPAYLTIFWEGNWKDIDVQRNPIRLLGWDLRIEGELGIHWADSRVGSQFVVKAWAWSPDSPDFKSWIHHLFICVTVFSASFLHYDMMLMTVAAAP